MNIELNISNEQLKEWKSYSDGSGIPLEYMIIEAVTFSIRNDRLGVDNGKFLKQKRNKLLKSKIQEVSINNSTNIEEEDSSIDFSQNNFSEHDDSAVSLDDHIPRNL